MKGWSKVEVNECSSTHFHLTESKAFSNSIRSRSLLTMVINSLLYYDMMVLFSENKPPADLETTFFDLECEMENNMCRDLLCLEEDGEREYLQDLSEVLMFLLLPQEDFHNKPFRYLVRVSKDVRVGVEGNKIS